MKSKAGWLLAALVLVGVTLVFRAIGPGGNGVLDRLSLDDGSEYLLTQEWNGWDNWSEPYTVEFWFRPDGGEWGWCYVDHEASRWRNAALRHDEEQDSVQVLRSGELEAELFLGRGTFALYGRTNRELEAPHELRYPSGWTADSLR